MKTLEGKKAVVLGGSRGIGAAIVKRLAREGAEVTFTYFGSEEASLKLAKEAGAKAVKTDSGDRKAVAGLMASQSAIDVLVVNSGTLVMGNAVDLKPEDVDRMIDINIRGPYHAAVEAGRKMKNGGRIIFIGSVNGDRVPFEGGAAYAMTKSAVQGMTRGLARDFGARGITVNNVQPGPVNTDMNPENGPMKDVMHSFMAIKRHAQPEEIAGMVAYLAGPEASIVTGAQHTIDGGFGA